MFRRFPMLKMTAIKKIVQNMYSDQEVDLRKDNFSGDCLIVWRHSLNPMLQSLWEKVQPQRV